MKKSFSQLKKDLVIGDNLKCLIHNVKPERVGSVSTISKKQTNAIATLRDNKDCWLYYPTGSNLVNYEDNIFTIYEPGLRNLTPEERKHVETMRELSKDSYNPYYTEKQYCEEHDCDYLLGADEIKGKRFIFHKYVKNEPCIQDNSIKGEILYSFEIIKA